MSFFMELRDWFWRLILAKLNIPIDHAFFVKYDIQSVRYSYGLIPIFVLADGSEWSLRDMFFEVLTYAVLSRRKNMTLIPSSVIQSATHHLNSVLQEQCDVAKQNLTTLTEQTLKEFNERYLQSVLSSGQRVFRQKFIKKLGNEWKTAFEIEIRKSVDEFVAAVTEIHQAPLLRFTNKEALASFGDFPLPDGTRFLFAKQDILCFVIEQQPCVRTFSFTFDGHMSGKQYALPYVVFVIILRKDVNTRYCATFHVFFRNAPLEKSSDSLYVPALSNISDFGENKHKACFPLPPGPHSYLSVHTPRAIIQDAIDRFWGSTFSGDWRDNLSRSMYSIPQISSFEKWHTATQKDPTFITKLNWIKAPLSLEETCEAIVFSHLGNHERKEGRLQAAVLSCGDALSQRVQEISFLLSPQWELSDGVYEELSERWMRFIREYVKTMQGATYTIAKESFGALKKFFSNDRLALFIGFILANKKLEQEAEGQLANTRKECIDVSDTR